MAKQNIHRYVKDDRNKAERRIPRAVVEFGWAFVFIYALVFFVPFFIAAGGDYDESGLYHWETPVEKCQGSFKRIEYIFPGHHFGCEYGGPFFAWLDKTLSEEVQ